jgi:hypothetical protein
LRLLLLPLHRIHSLLRLRLLVLLLLHEIHLRLLLRMRLRLLVLLLLHEIHSLLLLRLRLRLRLLLLLLVILLIEFQLLLCEQHLAHFSMLLLLLLLLLVCLLCLLLLRERVCTSPRFSARERCLSLLSCATGQPPELVTIRRHSPICRRGRARQLLLQPLQRRWLLVEPFKEVGLGTACGAKHGALLLLMVGMLLLLLLLLKGRHGEAWWRFNSAADIPGGRSRLPWM